MSPPVTGRCRVKYQTNSAAVDGQQPPTKFFPAIVSVRRLAVRHCCRSAREVAATALEEIMTNTRSPSAVTGVRPRWVLGLTSIAYFMVVLDSLVVVTALPRMQQDLHAGLAALQWTVNSYGIAFAAGIITAAALGDRFGRRRVFTLGLALFTLSSAACALAPDAAALIVARTVQGLGAAGVLPLSLTILTSAFPPQRRGLIVGIYGGLAGLAVAAGPLVGGAVTESLDWHWIFWLNVPIGLLAAALGTRLLPESHGAPQRLDLPGVALVTGGVVALVWALVRANDLGWSSSQTVGTLLAGCALLLALVWWQRRAHAPLVPLGLFGSRAFAAGTVTTFLMSGATFAAAFLITQEFQFARGYSPMSTGLRLLPFFATPMVISPFAGAISDRIGRRPIMVTGLALRALGFAWVAARGSPGSSCKRPGSGVWRSSRTGTAATSRSRPCWPWPASAGRWCSPRSPPRSWARSRLSRSGSPRGPTTPFASSAASSASPCWRPTSTGPASTTHLTHSFPDSALR